MEKELRLRIILTLKEAINAIRANNPQKLASISDYVIHSATILQSSYAIEISTLLHSLHKAYERERYRSFRSWKKFDKQTQNTLELMIESLEKNQDKSFELRLKKFFKEIDRLDRRLKHHVQEIIQSSKTTKASRIHEHGVSLGRTSNILGVSQYELMKKVGKTGIPDAEGGITGNLKQRLKLARTLFP